MIDSERTEAAVVDSGLGKDCVFALDIGTRSVIGVVGRQEGGFFHVIDTETHEHPTRSMMDGQIEDIRQVAQVAALVKERLERRLGFPLKRVCVAAAGRSLKTSKAVFELEFPAAEPITEQTVYELEMGAVSAAREKVNEENDGKQFYCVGHAVIRYFLDDYPFTTILNHKGSVAKVEVIATFLPNEVVESLCSTMAMVNLEIDHLTLEPIAAMNAVIPSDLRLLNLALVDIGAGTSDIATSDNGGVSAYTMATMAGDEITEEIIRRCLVDFASGEEIKHAAARGDAQITYRDILGFDYTISLEETLEIIRPAVESLSRTICDRILEANGKAPMAVFLVGGGSKVPLLCEMLADMLKLDHKKVAVGGNNFIQRVVRSELNLAGPEFATPIGIALTAALAGEKESFFVYVNGNKTRLFRGHGVAVMDVLLVCGYQYSQLMGKCGKNLTYILNGKKTVVRGGFFQPAEILLNGVSVGISTPVTCGDKLDVRPAVQGDDATLSVSELVGTAREIHVSLDGVLLDAGCRVLVNGKPPLPEQNIQPQDEVEYERLCTLGELCERSGLWQEENSFTVNGELRELNYTLQEGDEIFSEAKREMPAEPVETQAPKPEPAPPRGMLNVTVNGRPAQLPLKENNMPYQFVDMLNLVDIDPTKPQGNIMLKLNGKDTSYLDPIKEGDRVEIYWSGAGR